MTLSLTNTNSDATKNFFILIALALIWGSSYILMKRGLVAFSAMQVSALRIIISAIVLSPFLRKVSKKDIPFLVITGFLGSGLPTFIYPIAIAEVDSSVIGIINSLTPVFTLIFGVLLFKLKTNWLSVLGMFISLLGAGILVLRGESFQNLSINSFALFAVLAPMFYGLSSNILKSKLNHIQALRLTSFTFVIMLPFALGILFSTDFLEVMNTHPKAYVSLGYISILAVLGTAFALVLFNYLIKRTTAVYAASVTFIMPVIVLLWGVFDGENIGFTHVIALFLILAGVYILNYLKK
jgi:drug/metabolite transporter (DMT)-like permease